MSTHIPQLQRLVGGGRLHHERETGKIMEFKGNRHSLGWMDKEGLMGEAEFRVRLLCFLFSFFF